MACRKISFFGNRKVRQFFGIGLVLFFGLLAVCSVSSIFSVRAAMPPAVITYQGKLLQNGQAVTSTQDMTFVIYTSPTSGLAVYTAAGTNGSPTSTPVIPSNAGLFYVELGGSNTNVLDPSIFASNSDVYLEVTIGAETLSPRKRITASPFAINSQYLAGYFASQTPTNTAYIPVADAAGNFNFNEVTTTAITLGGARRTSWPMGTYVGLSTSSAYQGNPTFGAYQGYEAVNRICNANYAGSHLCRSEEIMGTISENSNLTGVFTNNATAWIANGPPGYIANSNDCGGFKNNTTAYLGAFWLFRTDSGGEGYLVNCESAKALACCK